MNFKNNLDFAEVILRYAILMAIGITAGILHQYWMVIPMMLVFLTAILGWCPVKMVFTNLKKKRSDTGLHTDIPVQHMHFA
ncbi:MAG: hypothetical protein H7Y00_10550 [Fimbriimonadaceae bacterium]|nr:hypothetical protein [Chitinophagales bacterium]